MPAADARLHCKLGLIISEALGTLDVPGCISNIAIISLNPLIFIQPALYSPTKNCQIIHLPGRKWTINVDNVSCLDAESDKVPKPALFVLEAVKKFALRLESEIGAVDRGQTVILLALEARNMCINHPM